MAWLCYIFNVRKILYIESVNKLKKERLKDNIEFDLST